MKLTVSDIVAGTFSNADGLVLKLAIDNALAYNEQVIISFEGISSLSSSFLNSSIGEIFEHYGKDGLQRRLKMTNYTPTVLNIVKKYTSTLYASAC